MSDTFWLELSDYCGEFGFYASLTFNSILLLMIHYKSSPLIGSYKTLLIFVSCFSVFYSFVSMQARPLIHMYDDTLFLIYQKWENTTTKITDLIPAAYCWCYSMSYALLALQFIYRYIAVCKYKWLDYIEGRRMIYWILGACGVGVSWASAVLLVFPKTERTDQSFWKVANESYELDPETTDYVPYKYFNYNNGVRMFDTTNMIGIIQHLIVITISLFILFFCGISIYCTVKKQVGTSSQTRELQVQLFRALVCQTLFPCFFTFIPLIFLYLCPILDIQLGARTNYQVIMAQLYPAIDPIVMLLIIEDYRTTLLAVLTLKCAKKIAVVDYDQSQYTEFMRMETDSRRVTIF